MEPSRWAAFDSAASARRAYSTAAPMSASLFDLGLFAFHNAHALTALDRGP